MLRTFTRIAFTMLEATIAVAIFASVMVAIIGAMQYGSQMQTRISTSDSAGDTAAGAIREVASELRYADINRIYLDGTAWTTVQSGSDYYSFKACTGFDVTTGSERASLDRLITYDRGIVLRFAPDRDGNGTLYRTVLQLDANGVPVKTVEPERAIARGLAWEYRPTPTAALRKGFEIVQLDPGQASVVGNRLSVRAAAWVGNSSNEVDGQRPWREIETAVYLRSSMFDSSGLSAPEVTSPATATGNYGKAFIYDIVATNDPTRYAAASLPPGLTYNAYTGRISGTPLSLGTYSSVVSAFNEAGSDAMTVTITINGPAPVITSPLAINVLAGDAVSYLITATGSPTPTAYNATLLPSWLTYNTLTRKITGTAPSTITATTKYIATISATNSNGTTSEPLSIQVSPQPPKPPVVTTTGPLIFTINQLQSYKLAATDNPSAWYAMSLPSWLVLDKPSGTLSGTPNLIAGYSITVQAANEAGLGDLATLAINVQEPLPIITSTGAITVEAGVLFNHYITALNMSNPKSPAYALSPTPPSWLVLDAAAGKLSGTPPVSSGGTTLNYTITASNTVGQGTAPLTITIDKLQLPSVAVPATTNATKGVSVSIPVSASPLVTAYAASGLPGGLSINTTTGAITGAPTATGTSLFTVTATNASGTGSASGQITVAENLNLPVLTLNNNTNTAGTKLLVTGTVAPGASGALLNYSSFKVERRNISTGALITSPTLTITAPTTSNSNFTLSGGNGNGFRPVRITVSITDTAGNTGSFTRDYN